MVGSTTKAATRTVNRPASTAMIRIRTEIKANMAGTKTTAGKDMARTRASKITNMEENRSKEVKAVTTTVIRTIVLKSTMGRKELKKAKLLGSNNFPRDEVGV